MKRLLSSILALSLAVSLTACGGNTTPAAGNTSTPGVVGTENPGAETEKRHVVLGLSMADASDANLQIVIEYMEKMLPEFASQYDCTAELVVTNASYSVDTQISDVESLIAQGCDAISIRSVDTTTDTCFVKCKDAGVPVCDTWFGTKTDHYDARLFVLDNYYIGQLEAQWMIDYADKHPDEKLYVGYLDGISGAADTLKRCAAFVDTITEHYGTEADAQIQILDTKVTENNTQTAMQITEDWMQTYPEMNCIIGFGDDCAMAAVNALKAANRSMDDYLILGVDGTTWLDKVGTDIDATVKMNFQQMARYEMELLFKLAYGEDASGYDVVDQSNVFIVDASNVDQYRK